jgi:hypothetical protein
MRPTLPKSTQSVYQGLRISEIALHLHVWHLAPTATFWAQNLWAPKSTKMSSEEPNLGLWWTHIDWRLFPRTRKHVDFKIYLCRTTISILVFTLLRGFRSLFSVFPSTYAAKNYVLVKTSTSLPRLLHSIYIPCLFSQVGSTLPPFVYFFVLSCLSSAFLCPVCFDVRASNLAFGLGIIVCRGGIG